MATLEHQRPGIKERPPRLIPEYFAVLPGFADQELWPRTRRVEEGRLAGTYWQPAVSLPRSSVVARIPYYGRFSGLSCGLLTGKQLSVTNTCVPSHISLHHPLVNARPEKRASRSPDESAVAPGHSPRQPASEEPA